MYICNKSEFINEIKFIFQMYISLKDYDSKLYQNVDDMDA